MRNALARLFARRPTPLVVPLLTALLAPALLAPALLAREVPSPRAFHERWRWARFAVEQGLPSNDVHSVLDAEGQTFAATAKGLAVYDGWHWRALGAEQGLPATPIGHLSASRDGEIWIVSAGALYRGTPDRFREVELPPELDDAHVLASAHLRDGTHVIELHLPRSHGARGERFLLRGVDTFEPFPTPSPIPPAGEPDLRVAPDGALWLYTVEGLQRFDGARWSTILPGARRAGGTDGPLAFDERGRAVFGVEEPLAQRGLWSWDGEETRRLDAGGPSVPVLLARGPADSVLCQYDTHDLRLWSSGAWHTIDPCPPELLSARSLRFRPNGDLWVSSPEGLYLVRLFRQRWEHYQHGGFNDPRDRVNTIARTRSGDLWVGHTSGVEVRDADGDVVPGIALPEPAVVTSIAEDDDGVVWVSSGSTMRGLLGWKDGAWRRLTEDTEGRPLPLIHRIRRDSAGTLWLLSLAEEPSEPFVHDGDVHVLRDGQVEHWDEAAALGGARCYDVVRTADDALWFATSRGLSRLADGSWTHWTAGDGLEHPTVFRIQPFGEDGVWFAQPMTGIGTLRGGGSPTYLPLEHSSFVRIWDIAPDGERLWVTTNLGIRLVQTGDPAGSLEAIEGLTGLHAPKAWPILVEPQRVLIGTLGAGLYVLDRAPGQTPPPRVVPQLLREEDGDRLEWEVESYWGDPSPALVATRSRVDDGPWSPFGSERARSLAGLARGHHRFEVQARGPLGTLGPVASVEGEFHVPLYQRIEFQIPLALAGLALAALFALYQLRRHQHAQAIRESARRYQQLLDYGSDAVLMCDADGVIQNANARARGAFGEEVSASGQRLRELLCGDDPAAVLALSAAFSSHRPVTTRLSLRGADGRSIPFEARLVTVSDDQVQVVLRDLTDDESVREKGRALEDWAAEVQSFADLGRVAGPVFRELSDRTCSILGHADQARRAVESGATTGEETAQHLRTVIEEAERAGRVTEELLVYASQTPGAPAAVDLNRLLGDLERPLSFLSRPAEAVRLELDPGVPLAQTDGARAGHLILRLAELLTSTTERRGRVLELRTCTVRRDPASSKPLAIDHLGREERAAAIELRSSTGRAEGAATVPFLAEPARRDDPLEPRTATIRGLARATGAAITGSADEQGRPCLTVLFPAPPGLLPQAALPQEPAPDRRAVLVVDDDVGIRHVVSRMLRREGYECLQASSGEEGVRLFSEHAARLLCAVVDVSMPDLDGLEVRRRILEQHPRAHVFLMSGLEEAEVTARWRAGEECTLLRKPFPPEDLLAAVESERQSRRGSEPSAL